VNTHILDRPAVTETPPDLDMDREAADLYEALLYIDSLPALHPD
jgi:hypothetical protein